ncbi:hypothetical protein RvY_08972-2 [Ramazzottius varieornatus]|uniref:EGF-like domain-containing protein n=1 Tax=Ramazzottius varieornatus TaxID=947166 RepID=A0A1D1V7V0_RAMVA|nr:hypothetical protein RvY_08972-2 [Ramazzottius varieornatus]
MDYCTLGSAFHRCDANSRCLTTAFGYRCQCKDGYTGDGFYCEKFPVGIQIAATFGEDDLHQTLEDVPVRFNVSLVVVPAAPDGYNTNLTLTVIGLPKEASFDIGSPCNMTSWCFTEADFVFGTYVSSLFYPPRDWSGTIPFTIVAEMVVQGYWITGYSATTLTVIPVPDPPVLRVGTACFKDGDDTQVEIPVSARLTDEDSEELEVDLDGLPEGFDVSTWTDQTGQEYSMADNGSSVLGQSSLVTRLIVKPTGQKMGPFNATVIAIAREKSNGLQNQTVRHITVEKCPPYPDMSVIFVVPPTTLEDKNIPFQVSVRFGLDESPRLMAIHILDLPPSASFNRGHRAINDSWILSRKDLAEEGLELIPPRRYSGDLILTGRTDVLYRGFEYQLNSSATITILPVVNAPRLSISPEVVCLSINTTNMTFSVDAALTDDDGSESLILTYNIPEEWIGSVGDAYHGSYSSMITQSSHELINVTVASPAGFIYPIEIPVVLMAVENANADQNIVYKVVRVQVCDAAQAAASAGKKNIFEVERGILVIGITD